LSVFNIDLLKDRALELVEAESSRFIEVSHEIHDYAELGYEEYKSSKLLAEMLRRYGFDVEKPVAGLDTAFRASYDRGDGGPNIGYLAEYDALPDMLPDGSPGHACGHNIIGAAALGAGYVLSNLFRKYDIEGEVSVFGCPCEEGYKKSAGGKYYMMEAGVFDGVDVSMMIHPGFGKSSAYGKARAREHLVTRFTGRRHTSGDRHDIVNALDAAVTMINGLYVLKQRIRPEAVITYIISEGGVNPNITPLTSEVRTYSRSLSYSYLLKLVERIKEVARGGASIVGADVEFEKHTLTYAASIPNMTLVNKFYENLNELTVEVEEPSESAEKILSGERTYSTDYGWVSREIPSGTIHISLGSSENALHTRSAVDITRSPKGDGALLNGIKALVLTGIDFLSHPNLISSAKQELEGYRKNDYRHPYPG